MSTEENKTIIRRYFDEVVNQMFEAGLLTEEDYAATRAQLLSEI